MNIGAEGGWAAKTTDAEARKTSGVKQEFEVENECRRERQEDSEQQSLKSVFFSCLVQYWWTNIYFDACIWHYTYCCLKSNTGEEKIKYSSTSVTDQVVDADDAGDSSEVIDDQIFLKKMEKKSQVDRQHVARQRWSNDVLTPSSGNKV